MDQTDLRRKGRWAGRKVVPTPQLYEHGRLYEMPLADLRPDPNQPRKFIDPVALAELTESIKQQGVVSPILFRVENSVAYDRRRRTIAL
jgi:ParB-like chromosome segregation protein Spo0J